MRHQIFTNPQSLKMHSRVVTRIQSCDQLRSFSSSLFWSFVFICSFSVLADDRPAQRKGAADTRAVRAKKK
ncbi:hypothetical protein BDV28DRAFT_141698 [Aspergillus coremiiformis]|uniref:Uncharacterized protein n=1 Tax=Aspergillus coremiiformis TaxID=138285 RepID=A0A5N6YUS3_9EURO|nr:hypothetical protein BDV28DRAFT_141698 [Aspergillus coremiiformis]